MVITGENAANGHIRCDSARRKESALLQGSHRTSAAGQMPQFTVTRKDPIKTGFYEVFIRKVTRKGVVSHRNKR